MSRYYFEQTNATVGEKSNRRENRAEPCLKRIFEAGAAVYNIKREHCRVGLPRHWVRVAGPFYAAGGAFRVGKSSGKST